jgi:hypothetical protein
MIFAQLTQNLENLASSCPDALGFTKELQVPVNDAIHQNN